MNSPPLCREPLLSYSLTGCMHPQPHSDAPIPAYAMSHTVVTGNLSAELGPVLVYLH